MAAFRCRLSSRTRPEENSCSPAVLSASNYSTFSETSEEFDLRQWQTDRSCACLLLSTVRKRGTPDQNICESFDRPKHIKPQKLSFLKSAGQIIAILDINLATQWISLATKYSHSTTASENKLFPKWIYQNVRFLSISPLRTTFPLNLKDDMILLIMVCNSYLQRTNVSKQSTALDAKDDYCGWP